MLRLVFVICCLHVSLFASEIVNFSDPSQNKNVVFFLSTPKSGTNVITGCLSAITRKPISWFYWGSKIMDPMSENRNHISYNRLGLKLVSDRPLLYRTHYEFKQLLQVPSQENKLIFATRNPKELLYRSFLLSAPSTLDPEPAFIEAFLDRYLKAFNVYDSWCAKNRFLVFYEDFIPFPENNTIFELRESSRDSTIANASISRYGPICDRLNPEALTRSNMMLFSGNGIIDAQDDMLLQLLEFMEEEPSYLEDFLDNKQDYISRLLESYTNQHVHNLGGASSIDKPKAIYYTKSASLKVLESIDEYIKKAAPHIWAGYLERFQEQIR